MNSTKEIWDLCNQAEAERNEDGFLQAVTLETQSCYVCGFYYKAKLRGESTRSFVEDIIYEELMAIPGYNPDPEHREMILIKSAKGIWGYACKKCVVTKKIS